MSIGPPLDDSNKDNILTPKNNLKKSARSLQHLEKTNSPKKKKHLEFYKEGQQILY